MRREPSHGDSGLHTPADRASPFEHTRAPCARSDLCSCSSANDGLARPSQAADAAERSERACRCYRRTRSSTLDGRGHQGVGCSRVAAINVVISVFFFPGFSRDFDCFDYENEWDGKVVFVGF